MNAAAEAGYPGHALSLRGHGGSGGNLRRATMGDYVTDVLRTAAELPAPSVLVGHSVGGLVAQMAMARGAFRAVVLVAPVPPHPAVGSLALVARQHPTDALRILALRPLPLRPSYLFAGLDSSTARAYTDRTGAESPLVQYQLTLHLPPALPRTPIPMLVLGTPEDRLVPMGDVRRTARRYDAHLEEFPGMGHDLMLDAGWNQPFQAMRRWLDALEDD
jgi:pimeloyl-ACP methyl ester carboxylesterase